MIKRPLCLVCFVVLIFQSIILSLKSGQSLVEMPASSIFQEEDGQVIYLKGKVFNKKITSNNQVLYLKNNSISDSKIIVYDSNFEKISIGQSIYIKGKISHFDIAHNPGNFDQTLYYAKDGIYGAVFCEQLLEVEGKEVTLKEILFQIKMKWKDNLVNALGEENGTVMAAMLLGEKAGMDQEIKELYQKNGMGHILAISGLHVSFIGLGIYKILRKLGFTYGMSGMFSILTLSLYAMMIGFSISVFRAYVMLLLKIVADMTGRIYDMVTALMLSAALSVLKQPLCLVDAGFYLSYGAVLGILLLAPIFEKKLPKAFVPGVCVNVMLLPLQLWFYCEYPIYSIVINLIIIPFMSILLAAGILFFMTGWQCSAMLCKIILDLYELISRIGIELPSSRMVTGQIALWKMILYYFILGLILLKVFKVQKQILICYGICLVILFVKPIGGVQITMLDVGQGDGIFIKGPEGMTYFIDGGSSDVKEVGKYRMEPFLKHEGVGKLNYVFISHGDSDHCSGIQEMLTRQDVGIRIDNLVLPENYKCDDNLLELEKLAKSHGTNVKVMKSGTYLKEDEMTLTCLFPEGDEYEAGNEGSMVLELTYKAFKMLFTGDIEGDGEKYLTSKVRGTRYQVLKISHHGSNYSTTESFLDAVRIDMALISAGKNNSYGHPGKETMERLRAEKSKIYSTIENGAITVRVKQDKMSLEVFH